MKTIRITDNNALEHARDLSEAIDIVLDWHDYLTEQGNEDDEADLEAWHKCRDAFREAFGDSSAIASVGDLQAAADEAVFAMATQMDIENLAEDFNHAQDGLWLFIGEDAE